MKRSYIIAGGIVLVVTLWMLTGLFSSGDDEPVEKEISANGLTKVQVVRYRAQPMQREVVVQGQSQAKHEVILRAQIPGQIEAVVADKGSKVKKGDAILRFAADERPEMLAQARALVQQRQLEYKGAKALKSKGLQAERQLAEAMSLLRTAKLQLKTAELAVKRQDVSAPFDGVVQARHVDIGDYLKSGDPAVTLVELDPLVVHGNVSEQEVDGLKAGMPAKAELSNGVELEGTLTFVAPVADSSTRTFAVEMEVANTDSAERGGMSTTLRIPLGTTNAYKVSPALLSLNDKGVLGLKIVDNNNIVKFYPVEVLKSERDGVWLGGLPDSVDLITVGQGFVRDGEKVEKVSGGR